MHSDLFGIGLSLPPASGRRGLVAGAGPRRSGLRRRPRRPRARNGSEGPGSYPFAGSTDVFVSYRLEGAVERSGSVPGRALATVTAVDVDLNPPLVATTYAVSGGDVLDLACSAPVSRGGPGPLRRAGRLGVAGPAGARRTATTW